MEFGFAEYEVILALKLTQNNKDAAVELLLSGGATVEALTALATMAKFTTDSVANAQSYSANADHNDQFAIDSKMVIVVRTDSGWEDAPIGLTAKLVSEAVILAYQRGVEFDA